MANSLQHRRVIIEREQLDQLTTTQEGHYREGAAWPTHYNTGGSLQRRSSLTNSLQHRRVITEKEQLGQLTTTQEGHYRGGAA